MTALRFRDVPERGDAWLSPAPPGPDEWMRYFAHHSRSFRFAARFMPAPERDQLARVYAWCRYTDDLVDVAADPSRGAIEARLATWLRLSERAYAGHRTGVALLDRVMPEMASARVPFDYARELVAGMRMDLHHKPYANLRELRVYTYRVAGVIGLWLTELYGVHDQRVLHHAAALGHALQLTNILRDVGEDWARGRVYLPLDRLQAHGLEAHDLGAMRAGLAPVDDRFRATGGGIDGRGRGGLPRCVRGAARATGVLRPPRGGGGAGVPRNPRRDPARRLRHAAPAGPHVAAAKALAGRAGAGC